MGFCRQEVANRRIKLTYLGKLPKLVFLLVFLLFFVPHYALSVKTSSSLQPSWAATNSWLLSAECARETGILLVGCSDSGIVPYAAIAVADDPGHALLLGLYAIITPLPIELSNVSVVNSTVNFLGIFLVSIFVLTAGYPLAAVVFMISGSLFGNDYHALSPHPAQLGGMFLAAMMPLTIAVLATTNASWRKWLFWLSVSTISFALASLLRQSIGMMGAVSVVFAVVFVAIQQRRATPVAPLLVAGLCAIVGLTAPTWLIWLRDVIYHVPQTDMIEQHGIWHNLYIGLGTVDNQFGIQWNDAVGDETVKRIAPGVDYGTKEYYQVLRDEYFRLLISSPLEVMRIYVHKFLVLLVLFVPSSVLPGWPVFLSLGASISLALIGRRKAKVAEASTTTLDAIAFVATGFVTLILAQGAVVNPDMQYSFPILGLCFLLFSVAVSYWNSGWMARREKSIVG